MNKIGANPKRRHSPSMPRNGRMIWAKKKLKKISQR
jgi:hypothetical protein